MKPPLLTVTVIGVTVDGMEHLSEYTSRKNWPATKETPGEGNTKRVNILEPLPPELVPSADSAASYKVTPEVTISKSNDLVNVEKPLTVSLVDRHVKPGVVVTDVAAVAACSPVCEAAAAVLDVPQRAVDIARIVPACCEYPEVL